MLEKKWAEYITHQTYFSKQNTYKPSYQFPSNNNNNSNRNTNTTTSRTEYARTYRCTFSIKTWLRGGVTHME
jgi:hypothetical protein